MIRKLIGAVLLAGIVIFSTGMALAQAPQAPPADQGTAPTQAPPTDKAPPAPPAAEAAPQAEHGSQAPAAMCADSMETKAEVPALREMHEVIYPLWHNAWPNKDVKMMKELLPQVREHVEAVRTAPLPGILRDMKTEWDAGVVKLVETEKAYEEAAAKDDEQALLDAVEQVHARFESLMRLTWPAMKQLDDYHVVLYKIYHYSMPQKDLASLRAQSVELADKAKILSDAPVPKRFAEKEKEIKSGIARLWTETETLRLTAEKDDLEAMNVAVENVHTAYRDLEGIFR